ncbi:MAG: 16S rRNA (adenine(1518)-N(6)/adenine(1519)-N(6))-dimethyltransferase RsmA [Actinomycetota bacterium]
MAEPALLGARRLRELLDRYDVRPAKALGQNFVIDPNTIRKIVHEARLDQTEDVVEVGAGAGSLTLGLAQAARRVVAIEFDRKLVSLLRETLAGIDNVEVVHGDALRMDLEAYGATRLVGNLPYNIATPLVLEVLEEAQSIRDLTVMTQAEVGERLAAAPGSKSYGQASVLVAYHAVARVAARISRSAFHPVPGVDSVLVVFERGPPPADVDAERFRTVVKAASAQRRKMLRSSLIAVAGSAEAAREALGRARVDPVARPEEVPLEGFLALAREL